MDYMLLILSVCNINVKRAQLNDLNPTFIWSCRLGHINEKHIERLHKDGLLSSFDFESFDTCESCLLGKVTKSPFTGQSERASDLLGPVHTDVYGYIYLMRHKSESFEKFKEF
jgi:hypothetical protein